MPCARASSGSPAACSERHAERQRPRVIVLTECRCRDLQAGAHREPQTIVDREAAEYHARRNKELIVPPLGAVPPGLTIELELRPQESGEMVLQRDVIQEGVPDVAGVATWDVDAGRSLHVEVAPSLPARQVGVMIAPPSPFASPPVGNVAPRKPVRMQ